MRERWLLLPIAMLGSISWILWVTPVVSAQGRGIGNTVVTGRVNAEDPEWLRGLEIFLKTGLRPGSEVAEDGSFAIEAFVEEPARLFARRGGIEFSLGTQPITRLGLSTKVELWLEKGQPLEFQAVFGPSGKPVADAKVRLARMNRESVDSFLQADSVSGKTDAAGWFRCRWMIAGTYSLEVVHPRHARRALVIELPGRTIDKVELQKPSPLEVAVYPPDRSRIDLGKGNRLEFIRQFRDGQPRLPFSFAVPVTLDESGVGVATVPPPGIWRVRISGHGLSTDYHPFEVKDSGKKHRLEIGMAPGAKCAISGKCQGFPWRPSRGKLRFGPVHSSLDPNGAFQAKVRPGSSLLAYLVDTDEGEFTYELGSIVIPRARSVRRMITMPGKLNLEINWADVPAEIAARAISVYVSPDGLERAGYQGNDFDTGENRIHPELRAVRVEARGFRDLVIPLLPPGEYTVEIQVAGTFFTRRKIEMTRWAMAHALPLKYQQPARWLIELEVPDGVRLPEEIGVTASIPPLDARRQARARWRQDHPGGDWLNRTVPVVDGRSTVTVYPAGEHFVGVSALGFKKTRHRVQGGPGEERIIRVKLEPSRR